MTSTKSEQVTQNQNTKTAPTIEELKQKSTTKKHNLTEKEEGKNLDISNQIKIDPSILNLLKKKFTNDSDSEDDE